TASLDRFAVVWDLTDGHEIVRLRGHEGEVWSAAFNPDGQRVVTASADGTARIWDSHDGHEIAAFHAHEAKVWSAAFSPDGTRIITTSSDYTARIWSSAGPRNVVFWPREDERTGHPTYGKYGGAYDATFSKDGAQVVAAFDRIAQIIDSTKGQV